jgi:uncharacterized protein (DUF983 family)
LRFGAWAKPSGLSPLFIMPINSLQSVPEPDDQRRVRKKGGASRPSRSKRFGHLLATRCPRCYRGRMFLHSPYGLFGIGKMPRACRACGLDFYPEPGFYFGALFISYGIAAPFCLLLFLGLNMGLRIPFDAALILVALVQLALAPYLFHLSRAIWLYFHASYDPDADPGIDLDVMLHEARVADSNADPGSDSDSDSGPGAEPQHRP